MRLFCRSHIYVMVRGRWWAWRCQLSGDDVKWRDDKRRRRRRWRWRWKRRRGGDIWLFSDKMTGEGGAAKDESDCVGNNVACPSQMIHISRPYIRLSFFFFRIFQVRVGRYNFNINFFDWIRTKKCIISIFNSKLNPDYSLKNDSFFKIQNIHSKHCQRHYGPRRWLLWPVILVW